MEEISISNSKTLAVNIFSQATAMVMARLFSIVAGIALIRYLGVEKQGVYSYVISTINIFGFIADFGLASVLTRDIKSKAKAGGILFGNALIILLFQVISMVIITLVYSRFFEDNQEIKKYLIYACCALILPFFANLFLATLNSYEKMHITSIAQVINAFVNAAAILFSVYEKFNIDGIIMMIGISNLCYLVISISMCLKFGIKPEFEPDFKAVIKILKMSIPIGLAAVLEWALLKSDVFILYKIAGAEQNGYYSAATRIVEPLFMLILISIGPLYPRLSFMFNRESFGRAVELVNLSIKYIVGILAPFVVAVSFSSTEVIKLILGKSYGLSAVAMRIIIFLVLLIPFRGLFVLSLNATHKAKYTSGIFAIVLAMNIITNILLIPKFGFIAAAITSVATNSLALIMVYFAFNRLIGKTGLRNFLPKTIPALLLMLGVMYVLKGRINVYVVSILAILAYFAVLMLLKYITKEDLALIGSIFKKAPAEPQPFVENSDL